MAVYFVDSSALVKRYIHEIGSAWVLNLFNPTLNSEILMAAITSFEIVAAITRRMRNGNASEIEAKYVCNLFKNDLISEYQVVEIIGNIINSAMA
jgi:uncharacterized protein